MKLRSILPLICTIILTATLCYSGPRVRLSESEHSTQAELSRLLPLGTSAERARFILEGNGFECAFIRDQKSRQDSHLNFLYCDIRRGGCLVTRRWQVTLALDNRNRIASIRVGTGLIGL